MSQEYENIPAPEAEPSSVENASDAPAPAGEKTGRNKWAVSALEWLELFVVSLSAVLLVITFIIRHSPVNGLSMYDTLNADFAQDGKTADILLVSDLFYTPERGDIIVVQSAKYGYDTPLVKRIIAKGGDTLDIDFDTWTVTVNGEVLDEDYVTHQAGVSMRSYLNGFQYPLTIPEGYLFVMGDNRNGSTDSRDRVHIGLVDERLIVGHVLYRIYPFNRIGVPE